MAILKIARMGHPVLARPADPVDDPTVPEIQKLIADMIDTMKDASGAGLAAPQVHVPLQLVIFHVPPAEEMPERYRAAGLAEDDPTVGMTVLINPVIEPLTEETAVAFEGCLSLPGFSGAVPRYTHIRYRGLGPDGAAIDREARGFHARVVQHECDHLQGILYPQRMPDLGLFGFTEELAKRAAG
ncbi:MAG: peptide deformylase [Magnetospiraceae bacterium]